VTKIPDEIASHIETGARVAVTGNLAIVRVLSRSVDVRARVMELIESPAIDYNMIGGLKKQIDEVIETLELPLTNPELFTEVGSNRHMAFYSMARLEMARRLLQKPWRTGQKLLLLG